jgi:hypothetical protein
MRGFLFVLAMLLMSASISGAQNAASPRLDSEGNRMDTAPPATAQPHHPADALAPNTPNPPSVGSTTGQAPHDQRFPADRGEIRPVPSAPK